MVDVFRERTINKVTQYFTELIEESEEISKRKQHQVTFDSLAVSCELSLLRRLARDLGITQEVNERYDKKIQEHKRR